MQAELLCGKTAIPVAVPDQAMLLEMKPVSPLADPHGAILTALQEPIASPPLAELAQGKHTACIVISDITRPVPNQLILAPMLQTLEQAGIHRDDITILIATGMHRPNLGRELEALVGREIMDSYRIVNHECRKPEDVREIDRIEGAPIEINTHYLDAELKILTGLIEPHFYAGYSGGRKAVLPGISSFETMKFMHSYQVIDHPKVANCVLEGNIFHEYGLRVTQAAGADFILNVVINAERELCGVFGGHFDQAHLKGCEMVRDHSVVEIDSEADLVITSGGGAPLDATLYQVSKGLTCAKDMLRPGGTIVIAAECREGLGSAEFCGIMQSVCSPREFFDHYCEPENFVIDQWCAQNIYQALDHAGEVYIYSPGLSREELAKTGMIKIDDLQATVDWLLPDHPGVIVSPDGPYVVGKVRR
jgi:nickel-dependent lactate racemase